MELRDPETPAVTLTPMYCYRQAAYALDNEKVALAAEWRALGDALKTPRVR
jgi:hypothetical protein